MQYWGITLSYDFMTTPVAIKLGQKMLGKLTLSRELPYLA